MNCCHNHNPNIEDEKIEGETVYTCPMHPEIQEEKPGMCGECGMALVKSAKFEARNPKKEKTQHNKAHASDGKHAGHRENMFEKKFWVSLILTIPVLLYSQLFEKAFRFSFKEIEK